WRSDESKSVVLVEKSTVGFGAGREILDAAFEGVGAGRALVPNEPRQEGVADDTDAVCVGDEHRAIEEAGFGEPVRAGHIAVAVLREEAAEDGIGRFPAARPDAGDAGADGIALDESAVADFDTGDIGDGVERAGCAFEGHAEIARARFSLSVGGHGENEECGEVSRSREFVALRACRLRLRHGRYLRIQADRWLHLQNIWYPQ